MSGPRMKKTKQPPRREAPRREAPPEPPAPGFIGRYPGASAMIFLALSLLVFFSPMVFTGKVFLPPDNIASQSHRTYLNEVFKAGEYPLWTPYLFSGMPSLGSLIAAPYTNPYSYVLTPLGPNLKLLAYYFMIGLFTFLLARRRVKSAFAALFAALSFVYCAQVIGWIMAGHNSKVATAVFLPAIILLVDRLLEKPGPTSTAWLALAVGLSIVTSHMQITYYALLSAGLLLLITTIQRLRAREANASLWIAWGLFGVAALVGAGASAVLSLPVQEYSHYSIRGAEGAGLTREYATNWSLHPFETMTFLIPAFFGFGTPTYWGWMPFTDAPQYMGILPLFLAVLGVVLRRRERFTIYLLVLALFGLLVSFGKEFPVLYDPLFKFLPYFNKFRVPSMALVMTQIAVAILAALALDALLERVPEAERRRRAGLFQKTLLVFGGVLLAAGLLVLAGRGWLQGHATVKIGQAAAVEALAMAGRDFLLVLLFFGLGAGALWTVVHRALPRAVALPVLLVVTLADLGLIGFKPAHYQTVAEQKGIFRPTPTVSFLQADKDLFRILPLDPPLAPGRNWWAYFKLQNAYGYHPAKIKIYQDMIDDEGPLGLTKALQSRPPNFNFLRVANVKYLIIGQAGLEGREFKLVNIAKGTDQAGRTVTEYTYQFRDWLPRVFFADRYQVISDPGAMLKAMTDPRWNPRQEALLLADPGITPGAAAPGDTAIVTEYRPQHFKAEVNTSAPRLLYVSEVYYPKGWVARLDGKEVPILRANYAFRCVAVPSGRHTLTMDFSDPAFTLGRNISIASYGLIGLVLVAGAFMGRHRRPDVSPVT